MHGRTRRSGPGGPWHEPAATGSQGRNATARRRAAAFRACAARRLLVGVFPLLLVTAHDASAQEPRRGERGGFSGGAPTWWGSVAGGYQWSNILGDPGTSSIWNLDSGWSLRLTAEREIAPRTTIGLGYSYVRLPLTITGNASATTCRPACPGEVTLATYGLVLHSGGGLGLHWVYEGFVGALQYGNFAVEGNGASRFADVRNTDFAWALGTGIGYGLSRDFELQAILDYANSLHERANDLFQRRTTQHYSVRMGLRVGL